MKVRAWYIDAVRYELTDVEGAACCQPLSEQDWQCGCCDGCEPTQRLLADTGWKRAPAELAAADASWQQTARPKSERKEWPTLRWAGGGAGHTRTAAELPTHSTPQRATHVSRCAERTAWAVQPRRRTRLPVHCRLVAAVASRCHPGAVSGSWRAAFWALFCFFVSLVGVEPSDAAAVGSVVGCTRADCCGCTSAVACTVLD